MNGKQTGSSSRTGRRRRRRRDALENDPRWAAHCARQMREDAEHEQEAERCELFGRLAAGKADDVDQWCARFDRFCFRQ